jgi:hypothetical protein
MPTYMLTSPDGKKYRVTGEGTGEEALAALQSRLGGQQVEPQQTNQSVGRTALEQGLQGATFGFADELTDRLGAGIASVATGEKYGDLLKEARGNTGERFAQQMEQNPVTFIGANIGGALITGGAGATTKAGSAIGNSLRAGNLGARVAKGAVAGAASGGLYGAGASADGNRLEGAAQGAALGGILGGAIPAVGAGLRATKNAAKPVVNDGLREVGKLAQKYNIPLSLDQVSDSRVLKNIQKVSQEVPLSGQASFRDNQMKAFNRALFKTVGVDADSFTPETMSRAFSKVGGEFDALTKGKNFNIGGSFIDDLSATADDVASAYGNDAAAIFQKEAARVINDFGSNDTISGELISRQRARINALARKASDPNIKGALLDLENTIVDGITGGDAKAQAALTAAKNRYKNLIVLEPIANKAKGGMISPSLLNSRVSQVYKRAHTVGKSGEIGDLARVGYELLPELGGSDTTQKIATITALGAGAVNPITIPAMTAGVGINRAFQSGINRNQGLIGNALNRNTLPAVMPSSAVGAIPAGAAAGAISAERPQRLKVNIDKNTPLPYPQVDLPQTSVDMQPMSYNTTEPSNYFDKIARAESGGNPNAKNPNSSASGLYQFTDDTWKNLVEKHGKQTGITMRDKNNPQAQQVFVELLTQENADILSNKLGRQPTEGDLYVAHFFGAPQAAKFISNVGTNRAAFAVVPPRVVQANKTIFFKNGKPNQPRSVDEVYALLSQKVAS